MDIHFKAHGRSKTDTHLKLKELSGALRAQGLGELKTDRHHEKQCYVLTLTRPEHAARVKGLLKSRFEFLVVGDNAAEEGSKPSKKKSKKST